MSAFTAAAAAAAIRKRDNNNNNNNNNRGTSTYNRTKELNLRPGLPAASLGLYESQKRRDWNTFQQYLRDHRPSLELSSCSGSDVVEFLRHLDQFGESKVHNQSCPRFGLPPATCACPTRQAWGSLDAIIRRLHAAFEENGGTPEMNPFGARAVKMYLQEVRDHSDQDKARGKSCVCF